MTKEQTAFLRLAAGVVHGGPVMLEDLAPFYWDDVYKYACLAKMDGLLFKYIQGLQVAAPPDELLANWRQRATHLGMRQLASNQLLAQLLTLLTEKALPALVFKGPVLSNLYPDPNMRTTSDADLLVAAEHLDALLDILKAESYTCMEEESKDNVLVWQLGNLLVLEVHLALWEDYKGEQVTVLQSLELDAPKHRVNEDTFVGRVLTMAPTQHLIYQMYHTIKHLFYRGIAFRHFTDTALFVNRYMRDIDVAVFWAGMEKLGYAAFCEAFFGSCQAYLGLDEHIWTVAHQPPATGVETFTTTVLDYFKNDQGDKDLAKASDAVYRNYLKIQEKPGGHKPARASRMRSFFALAFPKRDALGPRYAYARRTPLLLPVAWVHQAFRALLFGRKQGDATPSPKKSMEIMDRRLEFFSTYGLLEQDTHE